MFDSAEAMAIQVRLDVFDLLVVPLHALPVAKLWWFGLVRFRDSAVESVGSVKKLLELFEFSLWMSHGGVSVVAPFAGALCERACGVEPICSQRFRAWGWGGLMACSSVMDTCRCLQHVCVKSLKLRAMKV